MVSGRILLVTFLASVFVASVVTCGGDDTRDVPHSGTGGTAGAGGSLATGPLCSLPGTVQFQPRGAVTVAGGPDDALDLKWLKLPTGFCAHWYATIPNTRQLRFAPNGELFVASPTTVTTGGGPGGRSAILVVPDANRDGVGDEPITYLGGLPSTQGMLFTTGYFYYQDHTKIMRVPYKMGDHAPSGPSELVADITVFESIIHWPKTLDQADDGTIYVANGSDQDETCDPDRPFRGGILKLDGTPGGNPVAKGLRNPIAVRCQRGHNNCFAAELSKDFSAQLGGREKLIPIRQGDDWGFPCCATQDLPYSNLSPLPDCSGVVPESSSFIIGHTPFAFDFEPGAGMWPAEYSGSVFVPLHGAVASWQGARIVAISTDPKTGMPLPSSDITGASTGAMTDFATGWDDGTRAHGRPATITFAADGRMFVGNDASGDIIWIAPIAL